MQAPLPAAFEPPPAATAAATARATGLASAVTLAGIGFANGVRFANIGGGTVSKLRLPNPESVASDPATASVATVTGLVKGSIECVHLLTQAIAKVQDAASAGGNRVLVLSI
jgi:hypothetical protein